MESGKKVKNKYKVEKHGLEKQGYVWWKKRAETK